jgi:CBS domain-containing protein
VNRVASAAATGLSAPADTRVADVMTRDILSVPAGCPPAEIARAMAAAGVHGMIVGDGPWGFVSDLDLVSAAAGEPVELPRPAVTVAEDATLIEVGRTMGGEQVSHLLITDAEGRRALGVVSTLDVALHVAFGGPRR